MASPITTALAARDDTVTWLRTPQAATMAQLDEQVRGSAHGLIPGDPDPEPLARWIDSTYGQLVPAQLQAEVSPAAEQAARVRHWQAFRLDRSAMIVVNGDFTTLARRLAGSGMFQATPQIPQNVRYSRVTVAWANGYTAPAVHRVTGPGSLGGEDEACAVTIDQVNRRIIEWTPTPAHDTLDKQLLSMMRKAGGSLPPWMLSGDMPYEPAVKTPGEYQEQIMAAASPDAPELISTLVEEANAVLTAVITGLVGIRRENIQGVEAYRLLAPEAIGQAHTSRR